MLSDELYWINIIKLTIRSWRLRNNACSSSGQHRLTAGSIDWLSSLFKAKSVWTGLGCSSYTPTLCILGCLTIRNINFRFLPETCRFSSSKFTSNLTTILIKAAKHQGLAIWAYCRISHREYRCFGAMRNHCLWECITKLSVLVFFPTKRGTKPTFPSFKHN